MARVLWSMRDVLKVNVRCQVPSKSKLHEAERGYDVIWDLGRLCLLENYQSFGVQSYTSDARLHQQTSSPAGNELSNSKLLVHGTFEASPPNCVLILRGENSISRKRTESFGLFLLSTSCDSSAWSYYSHNATTSDISIRAPSTSRSRLYRYLG